MESITSGNCKSICRRIYYVGRSIFKYKTCVDDGVSSLWTFLYNLVESFANCSDELWRNISSHDFANKLVSCFISFWINRLGITNYSSVLSCTTCLLLVQIVEVLFLQNGLSVIHTGLTSLALNTKFPLYSLDVNLQM